MKMQRGNSKTESGVGVRTVMSALWKRLHASTVLRSPCKHLTGFAPMLGQGLLVSHELNLGHACRSHCY